MAKSSELIVNKDGSLYHLALHPGEVAPLIITVGDPDRVGEVSACFDRVELRRQQREFVTHTGYIGRQRLTVISTGIGTDNIDIVWNELHSLFHTDLQTMEPLPHTTPLTFLRLGTSGAVRKEIPVDTILASETALGYDGLLHFYNYREGKEHIHRFLEDKPAFKDLPVPYYSRADATLLQHFRTVYTHRGVTVTAPGFYAPQGRQVNAAPRLINFIGLLGEAQVDSQAVTNIEMETAGIYGMSHLLGHRALSLSAILANRASGTFSKNPQKVVQQLIEKALEKLTELR